MRLRLLVGAICGTLLTLGAGPVWAGPIVVPGDVVKFADAPGTTGGGEFTVTVNGAYSFVTFCLQRTEYMDFSNTFHVDSVNPYTLTDPAANGGDGAGRDFISEQTAYLYTMFRDGTLPSYNHSGAAHAGSADDLQRAFWMFENELAMNPTNPFVIMANDAVSSGLWSGVGNVRVMNLSRRTANGSVVEAQDQLTLVPEPSVVALLLGGLGAVAARRRRARHVTENREPTTDNR